MRPERVDIWQEEQSGAGEISEMRIGDVRALLPGLLSQYAGQAQVIYMDPPFGTGQVFSMRVRVGEKEWRSGVGSLEKQAYDDQMGLEDYLALIRDALIGARDLLCDTGVVFLHVDFRMHARLRLIMDEVFGEANFLKGKLEALENGRAQINVSGDICHAAPIPGMEVGKEYTIVLRPEAAALADEGGLPCEVVLSCFMGSYQNYHVRVGDTLVKLTDPNPKNKRIYKVGEKCRLVFDPESVHVL